MADSVFKLQIQEIFRQRLEIFMKEKSLSNEQLAGKMGVTLKMIYSYKQEGGSLPKVEKLAKLCAEYGLQLDHFVPMHLVSNQNHSGYNPRIFRDNYYPMLFTEGGMAPIDFYKQFSEYLKNEVQENFSVYASGFTRMGKEAEKLLETYETMLRNKVTILRIQSYSKICEEWGNALISLSKEYPMNFKSMYLKLPPLTPRLFVCDIETKTRLFGVASEIFLNQLTHKTSTLVFVYVVSGKRFSAGLQEMVRNHFIEDEIKWEPLTREKISQITIN